MQRDQFDNGIVSGRVFGAVAVATILGAVAWFGGQVLSAELRPLVPIAVLGTAVLTIGLWVMMKRRTRVWAPAGGATPVDTLLQNDPGFLVHANEGGEVLYLNDVAKSRLNLRPAETVQAALGLMLANPAPVISRLRTKLDFTTNAREEVATRTGRVKVMAHRLPDKSVIWRFEEIAETATTGASDGSLPMMTVGRSGTILFMNDHMRRLVGERAKSLDRLFPSLPIRSGALNTVATVNGPIDCMAAVVPRKSGRSEVYLLPGVEVAAAGDWGGIEDLPVPLLKIAPTGEVLYSNRLSRQLLAVEATDGAQLSELLEGLGRSLNDWLHEVEEHRATTNTEFLRVTHGDRECFVQVTLKRSVEEGEPVIIAVLHDATELKTLEAQFVQSQKMQAIGQLAGGVAHDFNNLLTAISGHCDLLLLRHDQGDPDYGDLVQINQNANRAAALVGQLLAFSRKQNLRPEPLDLRDTLADLTHLLNRLVGEKVTLTLNHDPVLKHIRADKRQLEQVMMNLVVNARDAMKDGGEILIETEMRRFDEPLRRDRAVVPSGEYVVVKVSDQGIGIPADKLQKVFEPFYTSKRTGEGTGLGLSTAYGIIKQTGGFIFVDSVVGVGTSFTLLFPSHTPAVAPKDAVAPAPEKDAPQPGEGVILLVEDEAPVRAFASRALRLRGYTVLEAASAEEALERLEDPELKVDVFVTDVIMPGLDGPTWVRQALENRPDTRVVFVSGYAEDAFAEGKKEVPNSVFLPKPFSLKDLTTTVQRQLH